MQEVDLAGEKIRIVSVGGAETCIHIPSARICFDMGRCFPSVIKVPTVFFTHSHADHLSGIIPHCSSREQKGWDPPTYLFPEEQVEALEDWLDAWGRFGSPLPRQVIGIRPGAVHELKRGLEVRAFRAIHRRPTLGYSLCRPRTKLREEYRGFSGPSIAQMKQDGVDLFHEDPGVELTFCGDTTIDVLDEPLVQQSRRLILEVTFLDDSVTPELARKGGHIHIRHLAERIGELDGKAVLFTHPSQRHLKEDLHKLYSAHIPDWKERGFQILLPPQEWVS